MLAVAYLTGQAPGVRGQGAANHFLACACYCSRIGWSWKGAGRGKLEREEHEE